MRCGAVRCGGDELSWTDSSLLLVHRHRPYYALIDFALIYTNAIVGLAALVSRFGQTVSPPPRCHVM